MDRELIIIEYENRFAPSSLLREVSKAVTSIDAFVLDVIESMKRTMYAVSHARGISAIQIGVPLRIFVVNMSRIPGDEIIAINPEIVKLYGPKKERMEGCISLPNYKGSICRHEKVSYSYLDLSGNLVTRKSSGYEAFVIQHEIDHLNGILYWDYLPNIELTKI